MAWKILIPDRLTEPPEVERLVFGSDTIFWTPGAQHASEVPEEYWREADAILAWHELTFDAALIERMECCRVIVRVGVGFDNVDLPAAGAKGICVSNVPDYGTNDVADHVMALFLTLARGLPRYDQAARQGQWVWEAAAPLARITGRTIGIVGLGRIGTATAVRAKAFGMRVVFHDPYKDAGYDKALGVEQVRALSELLTQADVVSIHTPLTKETAGLANRWFFETLKPGGIFINTARGGCQDLDALYWALTTGRLRAAGLDVLPTEPPDGGHPLIRAWRARESWLDGCLLVTPHAAFYNCESYEEMRRKAAEEALRVLTGAAPRCCVNRAWLGPAGLT
jgi:phosphoglycerate dehydrogenase-like enzyme